MITETYCREKAETLVRDHNSYRKMKYEAACKDYHKALDNLIYVAGRKGWKITYTVTKAGYIHLA